MNHSFIHTLIKYEIDLKIILGVTFQPTKEKNFFFLITNFRLNRRSKRHVEDYLFRNKA